MKRFFVMFSALVILFLYSCGEEHQHNIVVDEAIEATCTEEGKTEGSHCSVCGMVFEEQKIVPVKKHEYEEATCYKPKICKTCGKTEGTPREHKAVEVGGEEATCTKEGKTNWSYCELCRTTLVEQKTISKLSHEYSEATCEQAKTCIHCGKTEGDPLEHKTEEIPLVEATCTKEGKEKGIKCSICDKVLEEGAVIPKKEHIHEEIPLVEATCAKEGKEKGIKCSICDKVLEEGVVIPKKEHIEVVTDAILCTKTKMGVTEGISCSECGMVIVEAVELTKYTTRYGYEHLGTLKNGSKMQDFYNKLVIEVYNAHLDKDKNFERTFSFKIDASEFGLSKSEANITARTFCSENKQLCYWLYETLNEIETDASGKVKSVTLCNRGEYLSGQTRYELNLQLYRTIQEIKSDSVSLYEKIKGYHDEILGNVSYAVDENDEPSNEAWAHNATGYFLKQQFVCEGYTELFALVLNYNGIECLSVSGGAYDGEMLVNHAWNLVKMDDGEWYWFDLTYNDRDEGYYWKYFCVTDSEWLGGGEPFISEKNHILSTETSVDYQYKMPKRSDHTYMGPEKSSEELVNEAYKLKDGEILGGGSYKITAKVVSINIPYDAKNNWMSVMIAVSGLENKPIFCSRITGERLSDIKVGDVITIVGQFTKGSAFVAPALDRGVVVSDTPLSAKEILALAYQLNIGESLRGGKEYTITGKITKVNTEYNSYYGNVTVTITVEGCEDMPIMCYRLEGEGVDKIAVGDIITVTGSIINYKGTIEFSQGCILDEYKK